MKVIGQITGGMMLVEIEAGLADALGKLELAAVGYTDALRSPGEVKVAGPGEPPPPREVTRPTTENSKPRKNGRAPVQALEKSTTGRKPKGKRISREAAKGAKEKPLPGMATGTCPICGDAYDKTGRGGYRKNTCPKPACKKEWNRRKALEAYYKKTGRKPPKSTTSTPPPPAAVAPSQNEHNTLEIPSKLVASIRGMMAAEKYSSTDAINKLKDLWKAAGKPWPNVSTADLIAAVEAPT